MKFSLIFLLLALTSCSKKEAESERTAHSEPAWDASFFSPKTGEILSYRETIESISPQKNLPISPDQIRKRVLKRRQVYDGSELIEGKTLHRYSIYHDGSFTEGFLFHWVNGFLYVVGSFTEDQKITFANPPIPIAHLNMIAGTYWHWPPQAPAGSGSRHIGLEQITVPAGTFDAYKVSIRKNTQGKITLREYWFAPKIGIVKEQNRIYSSGHLRVINTIELSDRSTSDTSDTSEEAPSEST